MSSFIELSWLARADKYILLPPVIFADISYGGYFRLPEKKEILIDNEYYPADKGLIVISTNNSEHIKSSIAHEWRHLWQDYQRGKPRAMSQWNLKSPLSYKEQIIDFFISDSFEYDALLFQLKKAPDDMAREWHEWIIKSKESKIKYENIN